MSDIRVIIVGRIDKADWEHNFAIVDAIADQMGSKLDLSQKAAANGVASLNADSKVVQVALNSERLNGKTEEEFGQLFILFNTKGAADGVAELDGTGKLKASQVPDSLVSGLVYRGAWNADTNTPAIPAADPGNEGYFYLVNVAGATDIDGITTWELGDLLVSNGTVWERIPASSAPVLTVAGKTGNVLIEIADVDGLVSALAIKKEIGAENVNTELTDFDDITSPDDYRLAEIAGMSHKPDVETGEAFLTVEKYAGTLKQVVTVINTVNMYSRVYNGAWSVWRALN